MAAGPVETTSEKFEKEKNSQKPKKVTQITYPDDITSFEDLGLSDNLLRGIKSSGFEKPSQIQQKAILPIMNQCHVLVEIQSNWLTARNKIGMFVIGILAQIDFDSPLPSSPLPSSPLPSPQALVLCPTRKLVQNVNQMVLDIGSHLQIRSLSLFSGEQIPQLKENPHFVVGTPDRVQDSLKRKDFELSSLKVVVLDAVDEILSHGFKDHLYDIFSFCHFSTTTISTTTTTTTTNPPSLKSPSRPPQVIVCSAAFPCNVLEIAEKFTTNPLHIQQSLTLDGIQQYYLNVEEDWKFCTLCDIIELGMLTLVIVYCNTRRKIEHLAKQLKVKFSVGCLTDEHSPRERDEILDAFRSSSFRVLITNLFETRSLKVSLFPVIINYDLPTNQKDYLHRIGRYKEDSRKGTSITFVVSSEEEQNLKAFQTYFNTKIEDLPSDSSLWS